MAAEIGDGSARVRPTGCRLRPGLEPPEELEEASGLPQAEPEERCSCEKLGNALEMEAAGKATVRV